MLLYYLSILALMLWAFPLTFNIEASPVKTKSVNDNDGQHVTLTLEELYAYIDNKIEEIKSYMQGIEHNKINSNSTPKPSKQEFVGLESPGDPNKEGKYAESCDSCVELSYKSLSRQMREKGREPSSFIEEFKADPWFPMFFLVTSHRRLQTLWGVMQCTNHRCDLYSNLQLFFSDKKDKDPITFMNKEDKKIFRSNTKKLNSKILVQSFEKELQLCQKSQLTTIPYVKRLLEGTEKFILDNIIKQYELSIDNMHSLDFTYSLQEDTSYKFNLSFVDQKAKKQEVTLVMMPQYNVQLAKDFVDASTHYISTLSKASEMYLMRLKYAYRFDASFLQSMESLYDQVKKSPLFMTDNTKIAKMADTIDEFSKELDKLAAIENNEAESFIELVSRFKNSKKSSYITAYQYNIIANVWRVAL